MAHHRSRGVEWAGYLLIYAVVQIASWWSQPTISHNDGLGFDGIHYTTLIVEILKGEAPRDVAPYVMRPGVPLVASALLSREDVAGEITVGFVRRLRTTFFALDSVANALTYLALLISLTRHVESREGRWLGACLFATSWIGPLRLAYYIPVHVDFISLTGVAWGLVLVDTIARGGSAAWILPLGAISLFWGSVHEAYLAIPVSYLAAFNPWRTLAGPGENRKSRLPPWWIVPLACSAITYFWVRTYVEPTDARGNSFYAQHALSMLREKPWQFFPVAWLSVFGPALIVVGCNGRLAWRWLCEHQYFLLYLLLVLAMCVAGGKETERYVFWAFPVIFVLVGRAWDELGESLLRRPFVLGLLLVSQILAQRAVFRLPDFPGTNVSRLPVLTPWGWDFPYTDLMSSHANPAVPWLATIEYAVLGALLVYVLVGSSSAQQRPERSH
jgi:hypothetical protein